jgi:hypothetical protein
MSPWQFTFNLDQVSDLLNLEAACHDTFVVFVCGHDGIVTLEVRTLHEIVAFDDSEHAWLRIERPPRSQYGVSGNRAELPNKVSRGTGPIHDAIVKKIQTQRFR